MSNKQFRKYIIIHKMLFNSELLLIYQTNKKYCFQKKKNSQVSLSNYIDILHSKNVLWMMSKILKLEHRTVIFRQVFIQCLWSLNHFNLIRLNSNNSVDSSEFNLRYNIQHFILCEITYKLCTVSG